MTRILKIGVKCYLPDSFGVLPCFSLGLLKKLGVRIKKLELNNQNLELMRTLDYILVYRGSYMSAHVLLNLLNKLGKSDKMRGLSNILFLFCNKFIKFNNTGA